MDIKQELFDPDCHTIKTEPDPFSNESNENCSRKTQIFQNEHEDVLVGFDNNVEYHHSMGLVEETNRESIQCKVSKIEEILITNIKQELSEDTEVKATDMLLNIDDIKQEVGEFVQPKTESEFLSLTSSCDLGSLKSEITNYADYFEQPCGSNQDKKIKKSLTDNSNYVPKKKRRYPCPICLKNCSSSKRRQTHITRHFGKRSTTDHLSSKSTQNHFGRHNGKRFSVICKFCGKYFMEKFEFLQHHIIHSVNIKHIQIHRPIHTNNNDFLITDTFKKFFNSTIISSKQLYKYLQSHTSFIPYKCALCFKSFINNRSLKNHFRNHNKFQCEICSKTFVAKSSWRCHNLIHANKKPYKCDLCFKKFRNRTNLRKHRNIHTKLKPYECNICCRKFTRRANLINHIVIHYEEDRKRHKSESSLIKFMQRYTLFGHLKTDTEVKLFQCDICLKEFSRRSYLNLHSKIHTDAQKFQCDICSAKFLQKHHLTDHIKSHTGERPFKCDSCPKAFTRKTYLKNHSKLHTENDMFECEICCGKFLQKHHLNDHLRAHTGEKPFKCNVCGKCFSRNSNLKRHVSSIHSFESEPPSLGILQSINMISLNDQ